MKERRTFLLPKDSGLKPADVVVTESSLEFLRHGEAALERRLTLNVTDLPVEIRHALTNFDDLHVRFESARDDTEVQSSQTYSPIVARLPSGLHIIFTPRLETNRDADHASEVLCSALRPLLKLDTKCIKGSEGKTFTDLATLYKRSGRLLTRQFYHNLVETGPFFETAHNGLCSPDTRNPTTDTLCEILSEASAARPLQHLDIDYDASADLLLISAYTTPMLSDISTKAPGTSLHKAEKPPSEVSLEIGVLEPQTAKNSEELSVGGLLTLVGEVDHASGTLFSFPSRHHPASEGQQYTASFQRPTGLHPKLTLTFPAATLRPPPQSTEDKPSSSCTLNAYWTLPSSLFLDRYQFSDPLVLASQNLLELKSLSGEEDLEAPEWTIQTWGSSALFSLAHPASTSSSSSPNKNNDKEWTVTIPTHLRYMTFPPSSPANNTLDIPYPSLFWACPDADAGLNMIRNPFDRKDLGFDGLFPPDTIYYHIPPASPAAGQAGGKLSESIVVPVLEPVSAGWVPLATAAVVGLGFVWVLGRLVFGSRGKMVVEKERREKKKQ